MKPQLTRRHIEVRPSPVHHYGVFANESFKQGELVEECYVLVVPQTLQPLQNYFFTWKDGTNQHAALALGYGSIYNHAEKPNADMQFLIEEKVIRFVATKTIHAGNEIFIDYGKYWFANREMFMKKTFGLDAQDPTLQIGEYSSWKPL